MHSEKYFSEKYIKEPINYGLSDNSKVIKGGILSAIAGISMGVSIFTLGYPFLNLKMPEIISFTYSNSIFEAGVFCLITSIVSFILLEGYLFNIIQNSLNGSNSLPEWSNYLKMFKNGFFVTLGVIIITGVFRGLSELVKFFYGINEYFDYVLILFGVTIPFLKSIYLPIAKINYVYDGKFCAFFDIKQILRISSLELLAVGGLVAIVSLLIMVIIGGVLGLIFSLYLSKTPMNINGLVYGDLLAMALMGVFALLISSTAFFYSGIFTYRSFTNYYASKVKNNQFY